MSSGMRIFCDLRTAGSVRNSRGLGCTNWPTPRSCSASLPWSASSSEDSPWQNGVLTRQGCFEGASTITYASSNEGPRRLTYGHHQSPGQRTTRSRKTWPRTRPVRGCATGNGVSKVDMGRKLSSKILTWRSARLAPNTHGSCQRQLQGGLRPQQLREAQRPTMATRRIAIFARKSDYMILYWRLRFFGNLFGIVVLPTVSKHFTLLPRSQHEAIR